MTYWYLNFEDTNRRLSHWRAMTDPVFKGLQKLITSLKTTLVTNWQSVISLSLRGFHFALLPCIQAKRSAKFPKDRSTEPKTLSKNAQANSPSNRRQLINSCDRVARDQCRCKSHCPTELLRSSLLRRWKLSSLRVNPFVNILTDFIKYTRAPTHLRRSVVTMDLPWAPQLHDDASKLRTNLSYQGARVIKIQGVL